MGLGGADREECRSLGRSDPLEMLDWTRAAITAIICLAAC
jgi:hypothetical protein